MTTRDFEREEALLQRSIETEGLDIGARYMALSDLHAVSKAHPGTLRPETVAALEKVFHDRGLSSQRQAFFVFKEAADVLATAIVRSDQEPLKALAISALKNILRTTAGYPHRAAAEALGSLPCSIQGPKINEERIEDIPSIRWQDVLEETGISVNNGAAFIGRCLVLTADPAAKLLVVKFARAEDLPEMIHREAIWMEHLHSGGYSFPRRFDIPTPVRIRGSYLVRLNNIAIDAPRRMNLHVEGYAICFIADKDYFTYPNDSRNGRQLAREEFREIMLRNSWLFGRLASRGILHSAPIGLFHNRVQRERRSDNGLYEWPRAGRLDRWLSSCSYPNFAVTGIRDFEHFVHPNGDGRNLYEPIGTHILSLLLVAGSYFRNKDRGRVGLNEHGEPVDARDLFDAQFLKELVFEIFLAYYQGFSGMEFAGEMPCDLEVLTARMIEEMGVDRHMEEILRVADQKEMTDEEFRNFLGNRGFSEKEMWRLERGVEDIVMHTGPHLGQFNNRISIPELIEAVGTMSALCVLGRHRKGKSCGVK
jgi:hypothetical protein